MDSATTPPATAMEEEPRSPKARASKRQRPLGDVTNLLPNTPRNPTTRRPLPSDTSASTSSSSFASVTPVSRARPAAADEWSSLVESDISTVYARRRVGRRNRTDDKAHCPGGTASCPPLGKAARTSSNRSTRKTSEAYGTRATSSSVSCHQAKEKRHLGMENLSSGKPKLPEDFVKKQRAYFEEVDAFELPEEEASETDLD